MVTIYNTNFSIQLPLHFGHMDFVWFYLKTVIISLKSINQLIFVMEKCCVLYYLHELWGFKNIGLIRYLIPQLTWVEHGKFIHGRPLAISMYLN
jgi:hypothetical protein